MSLPDTSQRIALPPPPPPAFAATESEELARMFTWLARTERMFAERVERYFGAKGAEVVRESLSVADIATEQALNLKVERANQ